MGLWEGELMVGWVNGREWVEGRDGLMEEGGFMGG